jgi:hypothetical protein
MKHTYLQEAATNAFHYDCVHVDLQGARAKHHFQAFSLGASQTRVNYDVVINGKHSLLMLPSSSNPELDLVFPCVD